MQFKFQQMTNRTGWTFFFVKTRYRKIDESSGAGVSTNQEVGAAVPKSFLFF